MVRTVHYGAHYHASTMSKEPKFHAFCPRPAFGAHAVALALMVGKRLMATPIGAFRETQTR